MNITIFYLLGLAAALIYKDDMTRRLIISLLPLMLGSSLAFATCEGDLLTEFNRPPNDADQGFVTDRIPLRADTIAAAYQRGIFPWAVNDAGHGLWYSPPDRGVLDIANVDIPRGDRKAIRKIIESGKYEVKFNTDFLQVITECALQNRYEEIEVDGVMVKVPAGRWITDDHIEQFTKLHREGKAHSVEVWEGDKMVGGLYGVFVGGYFSGESMFHKANDVTKLAYSALIDHLKSKGHFFIDTQQNRGLTKKWGGMEIPRAEFLRMIGYAKERNRSF